jgi:zinc-ribbon domain
MAPEALVCPSCGERRPGDERFCPACGMPLVHPGQPAHEDVDVAHERARKIKPQFSEGELVRVAGARHQAEAELVQGLLLEEGIPSMLRRTRGFDVPDMLAAGPRDVMVPASGATAAREVLMSADLLGAESQPDAVQRPLRLLAGLVATVALVAIIAWIGTEILT